MKIIKKLLIALVVIFVLFTIVMAFAPSKVKVERSLVINADKEIIFDQVNNLLNWNNWMPWNKIDPEMKHKYFGPQSGVGAGYSWESKVNNVGNGKITILESHGNNSLLTEMDFMENGKATAGYYCLNDPNGVKVVWNMNTELSYFTRWTAWMMDGWIGPDFEKGLKSLDSVCIAIKPVTANEPEGIVGVVDMPEMNVISIKDNANDQSISIKIGRDLGMLQEVMKKENMNFAGSTMCVYSVNEPNKYVFEATIPVDKALVGTYENITGAQWPVTKCLLYNYYGSYDKMQGVYKKIQEHLKSNNLVQVGMIREVYVTDPVTVSDASQILTKIYVPIK